MPGTKRVRAKIKKDPDGNGSRHPWKESNNRWRKRKLSMTSIEKLLDYTRPKRPKKRVPLQSLCRVPKGEPQDLGGDLFLDEKTTWTGPPGSLETPHPTGSGLDRREPNQAETNANSGEAGKCWIDVLPHEILLKIFGYLPLGMLLHTIPLVCNKWETLALDWTLWKAVENLTIKNMVISTAKLRTLLRTIPKLKKLELILRNDTEELLHELMKTHQNLEVLKLDRCYRSTLQMNILSQTVTSILEFCPKLKTVMLTDTYFHSKAFYKSLARKFRNIERINVTCTTKSEMDVFMDNLKESVSEVEFQRVPMMGRAEGKQIYWGPILGLVVRPIPRSPFHRQYTHDNYPTYAF